MTVAFDRARDGRADDSRWMETSAENVVRMEGDVILFKFADRISCHANCKGARLVAYLLLHPERYVPATVVEAEVDPRSRRVVPGTAGENLSRETLDSYRGRWDDLKDQLEEAKHSGDSRRAEVIQEEIGFLAQEVSRGVGPNGRLRHAADDADRGRLRTTMAIGRFLNVLKLRHDALWRHLSGSIRTGRLLAYIPVTPMVWTG